MSSFSPSWYVNRQRKHEPEPETFPSQYTGKVYDSIEARIDGERREWMKRNTPDAATLLLERMPLDEFQATIKDDERDAQETAARAESNDVIDVWLTMHPEFYNHAANSKLLEHDMALRGVQPPYTIEALERSYNSLCDAGLLELDEGALCEQHQSRITAAAEAIASTPELSEEEMYQLPMETLRQRAGGVL